MAAVARQLQQHAMARVDAGRRVAAVPLDRRQQVPRCRGPQRLVEQAEVQRQCIPALRIAAHAAVGSHELAVECGPDPLRQRAVLPRVVAPAEHAGHPGHDRGGVGKEGGGKQFLGHGADAAREVRQLGHVAVQPVALVSAAEIPPDEIRVVGAHELEPPLAGLVVLFEHPGVRVIQVGAPGHDHAGVAPGGRELGVGPLQPQRFPGVRREDRKTPIVELGVADVAHPLGEEARQVQGEDRRLREGLEVPQETHALVALRAVRGHAHQVAPQPPFHAAHDRVDQVAGAGEGAGVRRRGVEHAADQRAVIRCGGQSGHLDVAESVVGEVGFHHGLAAAPAVLVALRGAPQVGRVEGAVLVERLGVAQGDAGARGRGCPEAAPAHHVLTHVVHVDAGGGLGHAHRPHFPDHADRLVALRHEPGPLRPVRVRQDRDRRPAGGGETGTIPARHLPGGVIRLAEVDAGSPDGAVVRRLPRRVAHHGLRGAVAQLQIQPQQQAAAGRALHPGNGYRSRPPAAAQLRAHGVLSGPDQVRDVEGLVLQAGAVEGPLRCQQAVADAAAVDPQLEQAQPGDGHGGMLDRRADGKLLAHHRGRLIPRLGRIALRRLRIGRQVGPRPTAHLHGVGRRHCGPPRHVP